MRSTLTEFRNFISRGNVIDLAVAFVLGLAFTELVTAFVGGMLTPIISMIFGDTSFQGLTFTINGSIFQYGSVLTALISFLTVAAPQGC